MYTNSEERPPLVAPFHRRRVRWSIAATWLWLAVPFPDGTDPPEVGALGAGEASSGPAAGQPRLVGGLLSTGSRPALGYRYGPSVCRPTAAASTTRALKPRAGS